MRLFCFAPVCLLSLSAFATPDMDCTWSGIDFPYAVSFKSKSETAQVTIRGKSVQFGDLKCEKNKKQTSGLIYTCYSTNVADAGFRANLYRDGKYGYSLNLYEVTFAGEKLISDFPCWV